MGLLERLANSATLSLCAARIQLVPFQSSLNVIRCPYGAECPGDGTAMTLPGNACLIKNVALPLELVLISGRQPRATSEAGVGNSRQFRR